MHFLIDVRLVLPNRGTALDVHFAVSREVLSPRRITNDCLMARSEFYRFVLHRQDSGSREPGSIPVSALLAGFSALPTRKSTLTDNEHSRSCGCPDTRKKSTPFRVTCQRVKRQKIIIISVHLLARENCPIFLARTSSAQKSRNKFGVSGLSGLWSSEGPEWWQKSALS